ncbi:MAG: mechanosensitive ion channel, partial [Gemmatimonadales bacterium]
WEFGDDHPPVITREPTVNHRYIDDGSYTLEVTLQGEGGGAARSMEVVVKGAEGTVEEVGMRSTRIRTFYSSVISVPNGQLVDAAIASRCVVQHRKGLEGREVHSRVPIVRHADPTPTTGQRHGQDRRRG